MSVVTPIRDDRLDFDLPAGVWRGGDCTYRSGAWYFVALDNANNRIHFFDQSGTVQASLQIDLPDANYRAMVADRTHIWLMVTGSATVTCITNAGVTDTSRTITLTNTIGNYKLPCSDGTYFIVPYDQSGTQERCRVWSLADGSRQSSRDFILQTAQEVSPAIFVGFADAEYYWGLRTPSFAPDDQGHMRCVRRQATYQRVESLEFRIPGITQQNTFFGMSRWRNTVRMVNDRTNRAIGYGINVRQLYSQGSRVRSLPGPTRSVWHRGEPSWLDANPVSVALPTTPAEFYQSAIDHGFPMVQRMVWNAAGSTLFDGVSRGSTVATHGVDAIIPGNTGLYPNVRDVTEQGGTNVRGHRWRRSNPSVPNPDDPTENLFGSHAAWFDETGPAVQYVVIFDGTTPYYYCMTFPDLGARGNDVGGGFLRLGWDESGNVLEIQNYLRHFRLPPQTGTEPFDYDGATYSDASFPSGAPDALARFYELVAGDAGNDHEVIVARGTGDAMFAWNPLGILP